MAAAEVPGAAINHEMYDPTGLPHRLQWMLADPEAVFIDVDRKIGWVDVRTTDAFFGADMSPFSRRSAALEATLHGLGIIGVRHKQESTRRVQVGKGKDADPPVPQLTVLTEMYETRFSPDFDELGPDQVIRVAASLQSGRKGIGSATAFYEGRPIVSVSGEAKGSPAEVTMRRMSQEPINEPGPIDESGVRVATPREVLKYGRSITDPDVVYVRDDGTAEGYMAHRTSTSDGHFTGNEDPEKDIRLMPLTVLAGASAETAAMLLAETELGDWVWDGGKGLVIGAPVREGERYGVTVKHAEGDFESGFSTLEMEIDGKVGEVPALAGRLVMRELV